MKKTFLRFGLFLVLGLTTTVFYSCEDEDGNNGTGGNAITVNAIGVINSSSKITTVRAQIESGWDYIAAADYKNNGFTLKLSATMPTQYLFFLYGGNEMEGVTISDQTAKGFALQGFKAFDKDNNMIGELRYMSVNPIEYDEFNDNKSQVYLFYVDKNVTLNGQHKQDGADKEFIVKYNNLNLKKGWNVCYVSRIYSNNQSKKTCTDTFSNQKPSDVTLKWYFYSDEDDDGGGDDNPPEDDPPVNDPVLVGITIDATNVINSSSNIATVTAEVWDNEVSDNSAIIATASYKNNGFSLNLPATMPAKYLVSLSGIEDAMVGITVSDKTAKFVTLSKIGALDKDENEIGELIYSTDPYLGDNNISAALWFYVDKNVTLNGENQQDYGYEDYIFKFNNFILKKGWNICYATETHTYNQSTEKETYTVTYSTQKPSGVTLKWYFDSHYVNDTYAISLKSAKSLSKKKTLFEN